MQFAQPIWLAAGIFFCLFIYFTIQRVEMKREKALQNFAAEKLLARLTQNVSGRKRKMKLLLLLSAIFLLFVALARPQYGHHWIDVQRKGIDILFAIDTSNSMLVQDIRPNRLERSKYAILDFVNQLEGDRIGLMPFAGSAYLMCPLTVDYRAFEHSLQELRTDIIPTPGTNIAQAIEKAGSILKNEANHKLLIIITDGENLDGDIALAATQAAESGMTIFTVGVGTSEGELIPSGEEGKQGFLKDASGQFVTSKLDEEALKKISETTDGLYAPLGNEGQGLEMIYQEKLRRIPKELVAEKRHKVPIERFPWVLALSLGILVMEYLISTRKTTKHSLHLPKKLFPGKLLFLPLLISPLLYSPNANGSPGEDAFWDKDYLTASQYYEEALEKDPENSTLHYNYGTSAYKNNLYEEAITSFNHALKSDDLKLQAKSYYNLGNAHYKKGEELLQGDPKKTIQHWKDAITAYSANLQLHPENTAAQQNQTLVKKKLEELEKQQQQQKDKKDQKDNQDQDNGEDEQGQNEGDKQGQKENTRQDQDQQTQNKQEQQNQPDKQDEQSGADPSKEDEGKDSPAEALNQDKENDEPSPGQEEENKKEKEQAMQSEKEQNKEGEMSKEEALQLLNELRNEEGTLNFIPAKKSAPTDNNRRNW